MTLAESILAEGEIVSFRAKGFSMQPAIRDGDILYIKGVLPSSLKRGDILFCKDGSDRATVHRLVGIKKGRGGFVFTTKGDAMPWADGPVPEEKTLGKVIAVSRRGKKKDMEGLGVRLVNALRFHPAVLALKRAFRHADKRDRR